jgi:predicted DNA-binding transcriptional regulator AlpA
MSEQAILQRLDSLTAAFVAMAKLTGARLTRAQMLERLGVSSNTLTSRVRAGMVPKPGKDGKWLLSEVVEWESRDASR